MQPSILDSFLVTNKAAMRMAIKVSVSVWGAFVIALLLGFEHPLWAMITGMISFLGIEHAQVMKKCLFQCLSTLGGGTVGLLIMASMTQSPLLAAITVAAVVFACGFLSANTRDLNIAFCCAIFIVTVNIMVMVPVALNPTTSTLLEIFIDRVGAVGAGVIWATLVSTALWPAFSGHQLREQARRLIGLADTFGDHIDAGDDVFAGHLDAMRNGMVDVEDTASHSEFEGNWGRRGAAVAREINRVAMAFVGVAVTAHRHAGQREQGMSRLAVHLDAMHDLSDSLSRAQRRNVSGLKLSTKHPLGNALRTGFRSALLFLLAFFFWSATGWGYGFLIGVVPIVFSIMFAKLPHSGVLVKRALIGSLVAIPPAFVVFVLLAQAPSALEIMLVTAAPPLFLGLMGLSSLVTFPYCLGYCLNFMILLLPQNIPVTDTVFAVERTLGFSMGLAILVLLFNLIPPAPARHL